MCNLRRQILKMQMTLNLPKSNNKLPSMMWLLCSTSAGFTPERGWDSLWNTHFRHRNKFPPSFHTWPTLSSVTYHFHHDADGTAAE